MDLRARCIGRNGLDPHRRTGLCVSGSVDIAGHTCSVGPEDYNLGLSERRANAVVGYLSANGIGRARLTAQGFGEAQPVADNASRDGRAQNRRVELTPNR